MTHRITNARAAADLRWFFDEGEGALGLRAQAYEPRGGPSAGFEVARSMEGAAIRWSEVRARLASLAPGRERVLRLAYTSRPWPGLERWYELAGVAALALERERLAEPVGFLRPVVLERGDLAGVAVRSGATIPIAAAERHEGLVGSGKRAAALKGKPAEALRDLAAAMLAEALSAYSAGSR